MHVKARGRLILTFDIPTLACTYEKLVNSESCLTLRLLQESKIQSCQRMSLFEQLRKDEHGVFSKWKCSNMQFYGMLRPFLKRSLAKLALKVRPNGNTCSPATY